ncbi:hypothetical protein Leryth_003046 [Lithospermum erythrorhizon]|nr:hypothetical protein Leryth_003046 [Lithospermum erythrorhizon]
MGGACSRKRDPPVNEESLHRGVSGRFCKTGSLKWLGRSSSRASVDVKSGQGRCMSLMELCILKICEDINQYTTLSMLPRDVSQQVFDELVYSQRLNDIILETFRDCALEDLNLGDYPGFNDRWMEVISSQGPSLLSVDLSGSGVSDSLLVQLKDCENLQALNFNYCDQITDCGLKYISGFLRLTTLSLRRNNSLTAQGMSALSKLVNLVKLDVERCPKIHGGLAHLKGLTKLEYLNLNCCNCVEDADMNDISGLANLKSLHISSSMVTDDGVSFLKGILVFSFMLVH